MSTPETDPLIIRERLTELFRHPNLLPENLLAFLVDYLAVNMPEIPIGHIIGSTGGENVTGTLDANVTIATPAFYDGPSASFAAGTWLLGGHVVCQARTTGDGIFTGKLWDGTTTYDAASAYMATATGEVELSFLRVVTLSATATLKISVKDVRGGPDALILAAPQFNSPGNYASVITGTRLS